MARGMGGKESGNPDLVGMSGSLIRSGGSANPYTRFTAHSNCSSEKLTHVEGNLVPHDIIGCP